MADLQTQKQEVFDYIHAMLGGGMVDVELDPIHYETALTKALNRYRQRSDASVEESYLFLTLVDRPYISYLFTLMQIGWVSAVHTLILKYNIYIIL